MSTSQPPNIVMILSDDHGYGDASCYGGPHVQTPNIDRLAASGVRFTQFYANSPVCSPSRAALLTGRYPDTVGVPGVIRTDPGHSWGYFDPAAVTLPTMLRRAGYHTTIVGKWHLGLEEENHPLRRGFDEFRGFLGDMMDDYFTHMRDGHNFMREGYETVDPEGHATDIFTRWAVETIRTQAAAETPFFLYLAYNAPHTPIQPKPEWVEKVRAREPEASDQRVRYLALTEHMDEGIGQVLDALEAAGVAGNTLVVYASDNGGEERAGACNDPWRGQKGDVYEGGIRVPCAATWPGHIAPGRVDATPGLLMDFFPTFCAAAGVAVDHAIEGQSMLPLLEGEPMDMSERTLYWVRREGGGAFGRFMTGQDYHAVRQGDLKLLHNSPYSELEMFNLAEDALETTNLVREDDPDFDRLRSAMQARIQAGGGVPWQKRE
ncbi:MAG: sulfatase-like hydrolase/transferase [Verrucomicrobiota bacterium]